nr:response regulator transcription factor [Micromonospora sp. DSM 115978]
MLAISGNSPFMIHVSVRIVDRFIRSEVERAVGQDPLFSAAGVEHVARCAHPHHRTVDIVGPDAIGSGADLSWPYRPGTPYPVVIFNRPDDPRLDLTVMAGVRGLILVGDPDQGLKRAIVTVALGGAWIAPELAARILDRVSSFLSPTPVDAPFGRLTPRETETAQLVAAGLSNAEIAAAHHVTESAVKFQVSSLLRKFGCRRRGQLSAAMHGLPTSRTLSPTAGAG